MLDARQITDCTARSLKCRGKVVNGVKMKPQMGAICITLGHDRLPAHLCRHPLPEVRALESVAQDALWSGNSMRCRVVRNDARPPQFSISVYLFAHQVPRHLAF